MTAFAALALTPMLMISAPKDATLASQAGDAVSGPPRSAPLKGEALERECRCVAELLRCPVCQGLSVADSPSSMARSMHDQACNLLARGYDREQVLRYFEHSYGEFVRLKPPLRGLNWLVWLAPVLALAVGVFIVASALRREGARLTKMPESSPEPALDPYVRRARELASTRPEERRGNAAADKQVDSNGGTCD